MLYLDLFHWWNHRYSTLCLARTSYAVDWMGFGYTAYRESLTFHPIPSNPKFVPLYSAINQTVRVGFSFIARRSFIFVRSYVQWNRYNRPRVKYIHLIRFMIREVIYRVLRQRVQFCIYSLWTKKMLKTFRQFGMPMWHNCHWAIIVYFWIQGMCEGQDINCWMCNHTTIYIYITV